MATIILFIILLILVAIFSVQNAIPVIINLFFWRFEASLAIIIFLSFLIGLLGGFVLILYIKFRRRGYTFDKFSNHDEKGNS